MPADWPVEVVSVQGQQYLITAPVKIPDHGAEPTHHYTIPVVHSPFKPEERLFFALFLVSVVFFPNFNKFVMKIHI